MEPRERFEELFNEWLKVSRSPPHMYASNTSRICQLDSYKGIVNMGNGALPFIFEKMEEGYFLLNSAVEKITGISRSEIRETNGDASSEQEISALWLKWWSKNRDKPEITAYSADQESLSAA